MAEADFQRYYKLDLRAEISHTGCRRLLALVRALPEDAAVWTVEEPERKKPATAEEVVGFMARLGG